MCGQTCASRLVHDMSDWVAILGNLTTLLIDQLHVIIGMTQFQSIMGPFDVIICWCKDLFE